MFIYKNNKTLGKVINMKKAQSISINTIVAAAIAIVVLLLLVMIFASKAKDYNRNTSTCEYLGGNCVAPETCTGEFNKRTGSKCYKPITGEEYPLSEKICCIKV